MCAPDDGWRYHPKHVEQFPDINKLCNVASCWIIYWNISQSGNCEADAPTSLYFAVYVIAILHADSRYKPPKHVLGDKWMCLKSCVRSDNTDRYSLIHFTDLCKIQRRPLVYRKLFEL